MPEFSIPPGYQSKNPPHKPKLATFVGVIDTFMDNYNTGKDQSGKTLPK
jgi:hypothetical protein